MDRNKAAPHSRCIIPKNLHFGDMNRHFQAKLAKYQRMHIIETTASITSKFCISTNTPNTLHGCFNVLITNPGWRTTVLLKKTRRPASADRTARRQFQATGQPVSRTQASDAMTSRLPRYKAKCVQCRCFQCSRSLCIQISREWSHPLPIY